MYINKKELFVEAIFVLFYLVFQRIDGLVGGLFKCPALLARIQIVAL